MLNVGNQCVGSREIKSEDSREAKIKTFLRLNKNATSNESSSLYPLKVLQVCSILFCFLPVITMIIEDLVLSDNTKHEFLRTWQMIDTTLKSEAQSTLIKAKYWVIFAGFLNNFPFMAKLTIEFTIYFHAYFVMWDINLIPALVEFNNLSVMRHMAQIDSIICSKSSFLNYSPIMISMFKIGDVLFENEKEINRFDP